MSLGKRLRDELAQMGLKQSKERRTLDTEHVWRHDRLAIGVWDLGSFRRPLKTAHYLSVATTGPTTRVAIATRSDAPSALALKWIRQQLSQKNGRFFAFR